MLGKYKLLFNVYSLLFMGGFKSSICESVGDVGLFTSVSDLPIN